MTRLAFVLPSQAKRAGGIAAAVSFMSERLSGYGLDVVMCPDIRHPQENTIYYFHGIWNPTATLFAAQLRRSNIPYIVSPHGMLEPWPLRNKRFKKMFFLKLLEYRFLRGADLVVSMSALEDTNLRRVFSPKQSLVVPLGLVETHVRDNEEAKRRLGWNDGKFRIVYLSRIDEKKGLDRLLATYEMLPPHQREQASLVVVGGDDSRYSKSMRHLAEDIARQGNSIEWVGPVWGEAKWDYLCGSDLFCLPTYSENFGLAILEALVAGTPVLTTPYTPWAEHAGAPGVRICGLDIKSISDVLAEAISVGQPSSDLRSKIRKTFSDAYGENRLRKIYFEFSESIKATYEQTTCRPW